MRSLEQCVTEAQVIVAGTALDSAPAPPNRPGDLAENLIRFRVTRVLTGKLAAAEIIIRAPTAAIDFIERERVVMLSPEYAAGKHSFAGCYGIAREPAITATRSR